MTDKIVSPATSSAGDDEREIQESKALKGDRDLPREAELRAHERRETVRDLFLLLARIGVCVVFVILLICVIIWGWHLVTPTGWRWLTGQQVSSIQQLLSGALLALFVGLLNDYVKRYL